MDIEEAVAQFGTEAVIKYRDLPAIRKNGETAIPEACLSLSIASKLIDRQQDARVEASYPKILEQLGASGADITPKFGGQRADIVIYDNDMPSAIIEIKIIDEGRRPEGVIDDWKKITLLQSHLKSNGLPVISGYIGALVCDTRRQPLERAVEKLTLELSSSLVTLGVKTEALPGGWYWKFVCVKLA